MNPTPPRPEPRALACETREEALAAALDLLGATRHEARIYTRDLDPGLLDAEACVEALRRLAISGRGASVRILVHELRPAQQDGHRLLPLAQRLPTVFQLRSPVEPGDRDYASAFLLNDAGGYLCRTLASRWEGEGSTYAPGRQAQFAAYFDQVWERSTPCTELRLLGL